MKQLKKTLLTLVALIAVTTGAWATDETLLTTITPTGDGTYSETTAGAVTVTPAGSCFYSGSSYGWVWDYYGSLTVTANEGYTITRCVFIQQGNNQSVTISKAPFALNFEERLCLENYDMDGVSSIEVYGTAAASSGPEVAWDKAKKTGQFTMPGGNVTLEPEYFPQAELTAKPTAINDVPATTDGAIVNAGTVANIGETANAQGTVMYYVSQTALDDADLLALAAEDWTADVPTAESFTAAGQAYVYYYVRGNDGDTDETTFSDGDILAANALTVTIAAAPTYAVTFADDLSEPDKWTASPAAGVKKGETVTVTYTGTKKVIGVKAEKKSAGPLAAAFKDGAKFKVGYQWNGGLTTYLEFTNSGGTYSLTSVSGANTENGFNSSTLTVKNGNVLALDVVCHPEGAPKLDDFSAQIEFDATSSTYKYSSKGSYFDGIISVTVNDADITSQLTPAN